MKRTQQIPGPVRAETRRLLDYLRDRIEDSDLTLREVERRCGYKRGYLSQVFTGHIELRLGHLEALLPVLGLPAAKLFHTLFPRYRPERHPAVAALRVNQDVIRIYGYGIAAIHNLSDRLEHCEAVLEAVASSPELRRRLAAAREQGKSRDGQPPARS